MVKINEIYDAGIRALPAARPEFTLINNLVAIPGGGKGTQTHYLLQRLHGKKYVSSDAIHMHTMTNIHPEDPARAAEIIRKMKSSELIEDDVVFDALEYQFPILQKQLNENTPLVLDGLTRLATQGVRAGDVFNAHGYTPAFSSTIVLNVSDTAAVVQMLTRGMLDLIKAPADAKEPIRLDTYRPDKRVTDYRKNESSLLATLEERSRKMIYTDGGQNPQAVAYAIAFQQAHPDAVLADVQRDTIYQELVKFTEPVEVRINRMIGQMEQEHAKRLDDDTNFFMPFDHLRAKVKVALQAKRISELEAMLAVK